MATGVEYNSFPFYSGKQHCGFETSFQVEFMSRVKNVAVLLCGNGEVEAFNDLANYKERAFRLLSSKYFKFPDFAIGWFSKVLETIGQGERFSQSHFHSPHNEIFHAQRQLLEEILQNHHGDCVKVFTAFNHCDSFLPRQVIATIREQGIKKLVIFPLLVVDSFSFNRPALQSICEMLEEDASGRRHVRYLPYFSHRPEYHQRLTDRIVSRAQLLKTTCTTSQVGIVLMVRGRPMGNRDVEEEIRQSENLYRFVRDRLIYRYPLISIGWIPPQHPGRWTTPDLKMAAQNLLSQGARALVFAPIGFVTENHETMLYVDYCINKLRSRVECLHVDCLNEDLEFMEMCARWLDPLISELTGMPTRDLTEIPAILPPSSARPNHHHQVTRDRQIPPMQKMHTQPKDSKC